MIIKNVTSTLMATMLLIFATYTHASSVSYVLDQSNRFEDGIDYLSVTLTDEAQEGLLSVTVSILPALQSLLGNTAGIEAFSFNLGDDVRTGHGKSSFWGGHMHAEWCGHIDHMGGGYEFDDKDESYENEWHGDDRHERKRYAGGHKEQRGRHGDVLTPRHFELPDGWHAKFNRGHGKQSMYDVTVFGRDPQDPLQFLVEGLGIEDILDEFAVRVTGLSTVCESDGEVEECFDDEISAYFYGGRLVEDPVVVPLPASAWLLGSGLLGLLGIARRRRS
jgi:hypothetical protein